MKRQNKVSALCRGILQEHCFPAYLFQDILRKNHLFYLECHRKQALYALCKTGNKAHIC